MGLSLTPLNQKSKRHVVCAREGDKTALLPCAQQV